MRVLGLLVLATIFSAGAWAATPTPEDLAHRIELSKKKIEQEELSRRKILSALYEVNRKLRKTVSEKSKLRVERIGEPREKGAKITQLAGRDARRNAAFEPARVVCLVGVQLSVTTLGIAGATFRDREARGTFALVMADCLHHGLHAFRASHALASPAVTVWSAATLSARVACSRMCCCRNCCKTGARAIAASTRGSPPAR